MKTILHSYCFDCRNPQEKIAYSALAKSLTAKKLELFESHGGGSHYMPQLDGKSIALETEHLFNNQWNTAPIGTAKTGLRVFDWAQDYKPNGNPFIKRGHWLDQTAAMREIRRNTNACGYCGKQEPAQKGNTFCPHCIGSEYLEQSELHLLRMKPVVDSSPRAELTKAEKAHLVPLYVAAQMNGTTQRDKARIAEKRASLEKEYKKAIHKAETEYKGFTWLMDHGVKTDNVIYYNHTNRFCFGWRTPVSDDVKSHLLDTISEFPFSYDIKCANGKTLSGD